MYNNIIQAFYNQLFRIKIILIVHLDSLLVLHSVNLLNSNNYGIENHLNLPIKVMFIKLRDSDGCKQMEFDDDLQRFEKKGALPLPEATQQGYVENKGAKIWYATYGTGNPVILLHGGLGHSGNWGYQVPALGELGYQVIIIDSRGHGRSTRDDQPYSYELMASDVIAVMNKLVIENTAIIGWSDGAVISMVLADQYPSRINGVFFFGCNMDPSGTKEFQPTPTLNRCFKRHMQDYAQLSPTPNDFEAFSSAVNVMMETQPNYSADDLAKINIPVQIVQSEFDEFIRPEHFRYLAKSIPNAKLIFLPKVSHFAPLQRPNIFNQKLAEFLSEIYS